MPSHKDLTGADLHEPKGASSATLYSVLTANGVGGTSWTLIGPNNIDSSTLLGNKFFVTMQKENPAGTFTLYLPIPVNCTLSAIYATIDAAPTGANIQVDFYNGTSTLINSTTFTTTATTGDTNTITPSSNNVFTAGSKLRIRNSTAVTTCGSIGFTFVFTAS